MADRLFTSCYEAFEKAGEQGMGMQELRAFLDPDGSKSRVSALNAGKAVKALLAENAIESCGKGRWKAVAGWVQQAPDRYVSAMGKLSEPEIGKDVSQEEYDRLKRAGGWDFRKPVEIPSELQRLMTPDELRSYRLYQAKNHEDDWRVWVPAMFPAMASAPFADFHARFWDHVWSIEPGVASPPHVDLWGRGLAKSASVEMAVVGLAARKKRKYCIYVSSTQSLADEHVGNIEGLLTGEMVELAYPDLANPQLGKHGSAKAWRRNRLQTASGFVVDALGLDVAARGIRIDEQRPDLIVFDDVDDTDDTPATVKKKIRAITRKLLPTGSQDVCVIAVQNKVHDNSIFARLVSTGAADEPEPADFLSNRIVVGPIPAVWKLQYEQRALEGGRYRYVITGGEPSWEGMPLEACQVMIDTYGIDAFLAECQHENADLSGTMFGHLDFAAIRVSELALPKLLHTCVWVDPAVSKTDKSDSCGVVVDSLGDDRLYYRRWAWERIAAPDEALEVAIRAALDFGAEVVGVETDQGGDLWEITYRQVLLKVVDAVKAENDGELPEGMRIPRYESAKAGSANMSKMERLQRMASEYNLGRFRHVEGNALALERGLKRIPEHKPYDVADCAWHSWQWLAKHGGNPRTQHHMRARAPRGAIGDVTAAGIG